MISLTTHSSVNLVTCSQADFTPRFEVLTNTIELLKAQAEKDPRGHIYQKNKQTYEEWNYYGGGHPQSVRKKYNIHTVELKATASGYLYSVYRIQEGSLDLFKRIANFFLALYHEKVIGLFRSSKPVEHHIRCALAHYIYKDALSNVFDLLKAHRNGRGLLNQLYNRCGTTASSVTTDALTREVAGNPDAFASAPEIESSANELKSLNNLYRLVMTPEGKIPNYWDPAILGYSLSPPQSPAK